MKGVDLAKDHFLHLQGEAGVVAQSCELLLFLLLLPKDLTGLGRGLKGAPLQFSRLAEFPVLAYTAILLAVLLKGLGRVIEGGLIPVTGLLLGGVLLLDAAAPTLVAGDQIPAVQDLLPAVGALLPATGGPTPAGDLILGAGALVLVAGALTPAVEALTRAGGILAIDTAVLHLDTIGPVLEILATAIAEGPGLGPIEGGRLHLGVTTTPVISLMIRHSRLDRI